MREKIVERPVGSKSVLPTEVLQNDELKQLVTIAITAALDGARIVKNVFDGTPLAELHVDWKSDQTLVSKADVESDIAIVETIRANRPYDSIIAEESGLTEGLFESKTEITESSYTWYVDSCDGSRPFTQHKPESTIGLVCEDLEGNYVVAAVVHPGRKELYYAVKGMGAYKVALDDRLERDENKEVERLQVSKKTTFQKATVAVDSYFFPANGKRKNQLLTSLLAMAPPDNISFDMVGSNISSEADVAQGITDFGITDCMGGPWDWRCGYALISESGGVMVDVLTGEKPTDASQVVIYGPGELVNQLLPFAQEYYRGYKGFREKVEFLPKLIHKLEGSHVSLDQIRNLWGDSVVQNLQNVQERSRYHGGKNEENVLRHTNHVIDATVDAIVNPITASFNRNLARLLISFFTPDRIAAQISLAITHDIGKGVEGMIQTDEQGHTLSTGHENASGELMPAVFESLQEKGIEFSQDFQQHLKQLVTHHGIAYPTLLDQKSANDDQLVSDMDRVFQEYGIKQEDRIHILMNAWADFHAGRKDPTGFEGQEIGFTDEHRKRVQTLLAHYLQEM